MSKTTKTTLLPYLILNGKARAAAAFYASALNGSVGRMSTFGEGNPGCADAVKDRIMHAEVAFGGTVLMMSDGMIDPDKPHNTVHVALDVDDVAELRRVFAALLDGGGRTFQELFKAPWGGMFGALVDQYGVDWMLTSSQQD